MPDPTQSTDPARADAASPSPARAPVAQRPRSAAGRGAGSPAVRPAGPKAVGPKPTGPKATGPKATGSTPAPPKPELSDADRARGRAIGLAMVGAAAIIALVVTIGIFLPALGAMTGGGGPVDAASLPETITVCGREYTRTGTLLLTVEEARASVSGEPVVVGTNGGCPADVCGRAGACLATVFVRTTDGRYADYSADVES